MPEKITASLAIAWTGTVGVFASAFSTTELWLGIVCGLASLVATAFSIRVATTTQRLRNLEYKHQLAHLCDECQQGHVPVSCPIPPAERPDDCPHKKPKNRKTPPP